MRLSNTEIPVRRSAGEPWIVAIARGLREGLPAGAYPLRFFVSRAAPEEVTVEATVVEVDAGHRFASRFANVEVYAPRKKTHQAQPFVAVQIIPTGVRCEFGGYAGDAGPATNLLAATADFLVTHPNAVNASDLNEMAGNVLYVEGKSLDDFLLGQVGLVTVAANRIGTFVDPSGRHLLEEVVNTLNAGRAVKGIDCGLYALLDREPGLAVAWSGAGCAVGTIGDADAILDGVDLLVRHGAEAIGGVSVIHGVTEAMFANHLAGSLPNPSGGIEAIVTHLVSKAFRLPTAHAPLPYYKGIKGRATSNPRAAAEFISTPHYFSVLKGLARAPRLVELPDPSRVPANALSLNSVAAVVAPASCLGGIPALAAEYSGIPLIAVRENQTVLDVTNVKMAMANVVEVDSYLEAAGVLLAMRSGISLESLKRPLGRARQVFSRVAEARLLTAAE